jgi:hypothetical protein
MATTFTTGEARQRDLRPLRTLFADAEPTESGWDALVAELEQVNLTHHAAGRENPILALFRAYTFAGDPDVGTVAGRFLTALNGDRVPDSGWDLHDDLHWDLAERRNLLRYRQHSDPHAVITAYKTHATKVLTRLSAATPA